MHIASGDIDRYFGVTNSMIIACVEVTIGMIHILFKKSNSKCSLKINHL